MNFQYIKDENGLNTGVFVPIESWNEIIQKFLELEEAPNWHKEVLDSRLDNQERDSSNLKEYLDQTNN